MPESKRRNGRDKIVANMIRRGAVGLGGQPVYIHNAKGNRIPCVYGDCWKDADNRYRIERSNRDAPDPNMRGGKVIEAFCSQLHKDYRIAEQLELARRGPLGNG